MKTRVLLGVTLASLMAVAVISGFFLLSPRGAASSSSSNTKTSSSSSVDPLGSFGRDTSMINVGSAPYGLALDPENGDIFAAVSGADTVVALNNQSQVVGNVTLPGAADFLAFDSTNGLLYATLVGSNSIAMINATSDKVVSFVTVGSSTGWMAYDPASRTVYSVNREANLVSVVSNASVVKTIALSGLPFAVAYDPSDQEMYVSSNAGTVFVINGTSNSLVGTVQVGDASSNLLGIAYNPSDMRIYVTGFTDDKVYILNGSQVAGSIEGFDAPIGIYFNQSPPEMFVVNSGNDTVTAYWNAAYSTVSVGSSPREVVYDSSTRTIVVTNYGGSTVSVLGV